MHIRAFQSDPHQYHASPVIPLHSPEYSPHEWALRRQRFLYDTLQNSGLMTSRAGRKSMEHIMFRFLNRIDASNEENDPLCLPHEAEEEQEDHSQTKLQRRVKQTVYAILSESLPVVNPQALTTYEQSQKLVKYCFPMLLLFAIDQMSPYVLDTFVVDAETGVVTGI